MNNSFSPGEDDRLTKCTEINQYHTSAEQCQFIHNYTSCNDFGGLFNYADLFYCVIGAESKVLPLLVSAIFLLVLFTGLGVTADDFLCPSLLVISKTLKLSQNVAGVTFLAFGNGAPDIFSSMAGIRQARPELVLGELFGAGIFVITIVAGAIFLVSDFKSMERPILRDILFYMLATFLTWCIFYSGRIRLWEAIAFIILYIIYIIVVIVGRIINNRLKQQAIDKGDDKIAHDNPAFDISGEDGNSLHEEQVRPSSPVATPKRTSNVDRMRAEQMYSNSLTVPHDPLSPRKSLPSENIENSAENDLRPRTMSHPRYLVHNHFSNAIFAITHKHGDSSCQGHQLSSSDTQTSYYSTASHNSVAARSPRPSVTSAKSAGIRASVCLSTASQESKLDSLTESQDFLVHICPIDYLNWSTFSISSKIFQILKAPLYFLLVITTPVVDYENHKDNWCRWLNCLQCILGPLWVLLLTGHIHVVIFGGLPIAVIVLIIGIVVSGLVYKTTKFDTPPVYHAVFGYLGFIVSVTWIYGLANEVVDLLQAVGIMFNLSDVILGLTVLAWGNSLGDLISNVSMARQGFPRMAISACFGGPLLNLLLGIGLPYTYMLGEEQEHMLKLEYSRMASLLYGTVTLGLASTVIFLVYNKFQAKKSHGIFLITVYFLYMTIAVLVESDIL